MTPVSPRRCAYAIRRVFFLFFSKIFQKISLYNECMAQLVRGIHHITAIASDPQETVNFYTKVLGLRLVKRSVNQDDVQTYHLFFGDTTGEPGMDLTFFTFQPAMPGQRGMGQVTLISLAVLEDSLSFWKERFETFNVKHEEVIERFGKPRLVFYDRDDQRLELVGISREEINKYSDNIWVTDEVGKKEAIRAFYSARLASANVALIEPTLTEILGYTAVDSDGYVQLYQLPKKQRAAFLEVDTDPQLADGFTMAGTVHHIAFEVKDEKMQLAVRDKIFELGLYPTEVIDRYYFKSVYFRTPAGILCEIATAGPGFTADEDEKSLGEKLALPPFLEDRRAEIEANLVPLTT